MKRKFLLMSILCFIMTCTIVTLSCSEDDIQDEMFKQEKECFIPRTRSMSNPGDPYSPYDENEIKYPKNSCAIWSLVTMLGNPNNNYWYNVICTYAEKVGWQPGLGLTNTQIVQLCEMLYKDSEYGNKLRGRLPRKSTADPTEAQSYIRSLGNVDKAKGLMIGVIVLDKVYDTYTKKEKEVGVQHWVPVIKISGDRITVKNAFKGLDNKPKTEFLIWEVQAVCYNN